jgi:hypothetical protein
VVSDQSGPSYPSIRSSGGNSAPRKADFGNRAPLAPRLAQPEIKYAIMHFLQEKYLRFKGSRLRLKGFAAARRVQGFKGSEVQGSKVGRFRVQGSEVRDSALPPVDKLAGSSK